jgi:hypothetical protein
LESWLRWLQLRFMRLSVGVDAADDEARRAQVAVVVASPASSSSTRKPRSKSAQRVVAAQAADAAAAQRQREQGLVGAQVLDAGDGERIRLDLRPSVVQVAADVAGHVLGGDQPRALHAPQQR